MAATERGAGDFDHHYTGYEAAEDGGSRPKGPGAAGTGLEIVSETTSGGGRGGGEGRRRLMSAGSRNRSSSRMRRRLKRVKAGFVQEKRVVADAFIEPDKNRPQYMKEEYSQDLLV